MPDHVEIVDALQQIGGKDRAFRADRGEMLTMAKLHESFSPGAHTVRAGDNCKRELASATLQAA